HGLIGEPRADEGSLGGDLPTNARDSEPEIPEEQTGKLELRMPGVDGGEVGPVQLMPRAADPLSRRTDATDEVHGAAPYGQRDARLRAHPVHRKEAAVEQDHARSLDRELKKPTVVI